MPVDYCLGVLCLVPLDVDSPVFFGFSEFLPGLALMVLAWTIADVRYRFRIRTAPLPLYQVTFWVVTLVGVLTLLTDLWRAEGWLVPRGSLLTPAMWQVVLGGTLLLILLTWAWFAFIRPPVYNKRNAERYAYVLYRAIMKGSLSDLAIVADEFTRSAKSLVGHATDRSRYQRLLAQHGAGNGPVENPTQVTRYADDILQLIADPTFCRAIVSSSPGTAGRVFHEIAESGKHRVLIGLFAGNIVSEALVDRDSFLFQEARGYKAGLIGYQKPISRAMFSKYDIVHSIPSLLAPDGLQTRQWKADQVGVYCQMILMTLRDYCRLWLYPAYALDTSLRNIECTLYDVINLDGIAENWWEYNAVAKLRIVIDFIREAVDILDKSGVPDDVQTRVRKGQISRRTFYDSLAKLVYDVIVIASTVRSPLYTCWGIQHNTVWGRLFGIDRLDGPAGKVIEFKVRRLMYDDVVEMKESPNFKGARVLGFCLNVMKYCVRDEKRYRDNPLAKVIFSWTKRNFAELYSRNPRVADVCLVDGMTYEESKTRLVWTYPAAMSQEDYHEYFYVDPPRRDTD